MPSKEKNDFIQRLSDRIDDDVKIALKRGRTQDAINTLERAVNHAFIKPGKNLQTLASLYEKTGQEEKLADAYLKLAAMWEKMGFLLKATDILSRLKNLKPAHELYCLQKNTEMHLSQGLTKYAAANLREMAQYHLARGENDDAQQITAQAIELENEAKVIKLNPGFCRGKFQFEELLF